MLSYSAHTNIVSVFGRTLDENPIRSLIDDIRQFRGSFCHPMLVPSVIALNIISHTRHAAKGAHDRLLRLEKNVGVRGFAPESNHHFIANSQKAIRDSTDNKAHLTDALAILKDHSYATFGPILEGCAALERMIGASPSIGAVKKEILQVGKELEDLIQSLEQERKSFVAATEARMTRTDGTIQAVSYPRLCTWKVGADNFQLYTLFALRDSKLNIQMAEDSKQVALQSVAIADAAKRDSSSMKFIAVLTTVFLPGTCVAVCPSHCPCETVRH